MSATAAVSMTRDRAKMPGFPIGMANDGFWKKYQNERMVELLCFIRLLDIFSCIILISSTIPFLLST